MSEFARFHPKTDHPKFTLNSPPASELTGWLITPDGPDMERWRIGDLVMTDEDLIGLAMRR